MSTIHINTEQLRRIVKSISSFSKTGWTNSEPNTKKKIIEPLLSVLGWDVFGNEVMLEYGIKIGTRTSYVDYALLLENKPVVFVEAKSFDTNLTLDESSQIISYGRVEDVRWAVLTNGQVLKVFNTEQGKSEKECLVVEIDLRKLPLQAEDLRLISRNSILTGGIDEAVKRLVATRKAIRNLRENQDKIAEEFKKTLLVITGNKVESRISDISTQLANQAIKLFENQSEVIPPEQIDLGDQVITREQLATKPPGEVVVCPSRIEGVEFLKKYNAWGFVTVRRKAPYFALYVGKPESSVQYFGEIDSITKPLKSKEDLERIKEEDTGTFEPGKQVIHLKPGSLVKLAKPIPLKHQRFVPKSRLYTTVERMAKANRVEDLWEKVTLETQMAKIKDPQMRNIASELRKSILDISEKIEERITKSHLIFRTSKNFARIYFQPRGFWLDVRLTKNEFTTNTLDTRPEKNSNWTDIRVDKNSNINSLIEIVKIAYNKAGV